MRCAWLKAMHSNIALVIATFCAGLLVGLSGIGAGALITPLLILGFGLRADLAVGTDLVYGGITKVVGAAAHWRLRHVDWRLGATLAAVSVPGSALGTFLAVRITLAPGSDTRLKAMIGCVLIVVSIVLIFQPFKCLKMARRPLTIVTIGYVFIVGLLVGLTGVGSGSLMLPFLAIVHRLSPVRAVATDIFHGAILVILSAAFHANAGHVEWTLLPLLTAGSIPGVLLGSHFAPRLPEPALRLVLSAVLLISGSKLIF
jgi:uncharacterized membrane protein YfcA